MQSCTASSRRAVAAVSDTCMKLLQGIEQVGLPHRLCLSLLSEVEPPLAVDCSICPDDMARLLHRPNSDLSPHQGPSLVFFQVNSSLDCGKKTLSTYTKLTTDLTLSRNKEGGKATRYGHQQAVYRSFFSSTGSTVSPPGLGVSPSAP